jgi:putative transposase
VEAITAVSPLTGVQTCIVHLSRYSLSFGGWQECQALAKRLRLLPGRNGRGRRQALGSVRSPPLGVKNILTIAESWERNWEQIIPFYSFAPGVRKIISTTNAIESLHFQLRRVP